MDPSVWSCRVEACHEWYQMPKYECFLMNGRYKKYLHKSEKHNRTSKVSKILTSCPMLGHEPKYLKSHKDCQSYIVPAVQKQMILYFSKILKCPRFWPLAPSWGIDPRVRSHQVKANYEWNQLSKYECFLINGWLDIWIRQKNKIKLFKDILDFDLQSHPGAETLEYWVMMWMPTLQDTCGPNMNDFW